MATYLIDMEADLIGKALRSTEHVMSGSTWVFLPEVESISVHLRPMKKAYGSEYEPKLVMMDIHSNTNTNPSPYGCLAEISRRVGKLIGIVDC